MEGQKILAYILIALGILLTLVTFNLIPDSSILFIFGFGFITAYYIFKRNLGFLIPGCIITAVAIFAILKDIWDIDGIYFLLFLGLAFLAIFFIHTSKLNISNLGEKYWPLYPGFILIGISIVLLIFQENARLLGIIIPLFLIAIGVIMLLKNKA
ncbi:MAG: hypothetical protein ACPLKX_08005 [Dictyoglomaceae bacterium]